MIPKSRSEGVGRVRQRCRGCQYKGVSSELRISQKAYRIAPPPKIPPTRWEAGTLMHWLSSAPWPRATPVCADIPHLLGCAYSAWACKCLEAENKGVELTLGEMLELKLT